MLSGKGKIKLLLSRIQNKVWLFIGNLNVTSIETIDMKNWQG